MKGRMLRIAAAAAMLAWVVATAPIASAVEGPIDLNTASEEALVELPGIGPSKARAIIEYREANPFRSVDELRNVRGIGEHTFETLKDKVRVGAAGAESAKR